MIWLGFSLLTILALPLTPVLVLLALPFVNKNPKNTFPQWLQFLNTPDDPGCDQGMYEPQVAAVYAWGGWYLKTLYWLGWRNQMMGLFAVLSAKYDGSSVIESMWWRFKIYSAQGHSEITWPGRRVSFGYKVYTLKTAKPGAPIWWVFMPAFWKSREY